MTGMLHILGNVNANANRPCWPNGRNQSLSLPLSPVVRGDVDHVRVPCRGWCQSGMRGRACLEPGVLRWGEAGCGVLGV